MFTVAHTVQYLENTILDKNVKKNARYMLVEFLMSAEHLF